jgi:hypothetical protein
VICNHFEVAESFTLGKTHSSDEMEKHMYLMKNAISVKCRSILLIVSLLELSFLLKGILPSSWSYQVTVVNGTHVQEFQMLRVLEPALRMKAQRCSNSRGQKDFICREFNCREEKRKSAF